MLSKVIVDEVFMHYFEKLSTSTLDQWTLLGDVRLVRHPHCPSLENPVGAHET